MDNQFHSVMLDRDLCKGCTVCIKRCPTEAIRVQAGKARIRETRCIDCGECIRTCPNHAKLAVADSLDRLHDFQYTVALPAPSLYGQFKADVSLGQILGSLIKLGFDEVYEVAKGAEYVSLAVREHLKRSTVRPLISSSCPAVVRLIQVRFPDLLEHLVRIEPPMEVAAKLAKQDVARRTGLSPHQIGTFFISPCPAKVTAVKQPVGTQRSSVDGVLSLAGVYGDLLKRLPPQRQTGQTLASGMGVGWARAGGENQAIGPESYLSVDGIHHVTDVLEEVERGKLREIAFMECLACVGGCVGGALTVENPFVARVKIRQLSEKLGMEPSISVDEVKELAREGFFTVHDRLEPRSALRLDDDVAKAITKMEQLEKQAADLPGLDCGACGSPTCRALAEDIVQGEATEMDCVIKLKEKVQQLAQEMLDLAGKVPAAGPSGQVLSDQRPLEHADDEGRAK